MPHEAVGVGYETALDLIQADDVPLDPDSVPLEGESERNEGGGVPPESEGVPLDPEDVPLEGESGRGDLDSERNEEYYLRHEMIFDLHLQFTK